MMGVGNVVRGGIAAIALAYLVAIGASGDYAVSATAIQVGVLVSTLGFLLTLLGNVRSNEAVLESIRGLLLAVTFNDITVKDAYARSESIFVDSELDEILAHEVNAVTGAIDAIKVKLAESSSIDLATAKRSIDSDYQNLTAKLQTLVLISNVERSRIKPLQDLVQRKHSEFKLMIKGAT